ncbi:hypothetical protein D7Z94_21845 [Ulvibacterium marinum]|uniref:Uncharacterized protein n=1 Tax=Ulvibacterium marinum TaxID=2419782 RepID=A0A3B0BWS9_9FLAO|nr:hypothetical protein D7Z94_21845 [Ulvibacterium marinum]
MIKSYQGNINNFFRFEIRFSLKISSKIVNTLKINILIYCFNDLFLSLIEQNVNNVCYKA